ncbi:hypothetical protein ACTJKH_16605 [Microbacterium sp. 22215]|uniref:hypothetical protein n=1 Tax=Microbacterium sp. 22215 TaxID=3453893 RepID=UPI003F861F55
MTNHVPGFTDSIKDGVYWTMKSPNLYIGSNGDTLLVFSVGDDNFDDEGPRVLAHARRLSQRGGITVAVQLPSEYQLQSSLEVFSEGRVLKKVERTHDADLDFRIELWSTGEADPWREWEEGSDPFASPQTARSCRCACSVHTEVEF